MNKGQRAAQAEFQAQKEPAAELPFRVGLGTDAHAFAPGRSLILGGVRIPHTAGLVGHSDSDVLMHAAADALLGAAALGDLGAHFPSSKVSLAGADSGDLLAQVVILLREAGWQPAQLDAVLMAQEPPLAPHLPRMRTRISEILGLTVQTVSVKATSTDQLGFLGRKEGIAAQAIVLIRPCPSLGIHPQNRSHPRKA